jgi:hypothetical protein
MDETRIYHITHVDNLPGILSAGALLPKTRASDGYQRVNSAHVSIQATRSVFRVPVGPGGTLHDYVPFHFGPRSPMLGSIHTGRVVGSDGKQANMVYLVSTAQKVAAAGLPFVFTDGHAAMHMTEYFVDLTDLSRLDHAAIAAHYWFNTLEDPDRKRRKQAEFLVHGAVPLSVIMGVAVMNEEMHERVEAVLQGNGCTLPLKVWPAGYY